MSYQGVHWWLDLREDRGVPNKGLCCILLGRLWNSRLSWSQSRRSQRNGFFRKDRSCRRLLWKNLLRGFSSEGGCHDRNRCVLKSMLGQCIFENLQMKVCYHSQIYQNHLNVFRLHHLWDEWRYQQTQLNIPYCSFSNTHLHRNNLFKHH